MKKENPKKICLTSFLKKICEENNFELLKEYKNYVKDKNADSLADKVITFLFLKRAEYYRQIIVYGLRKNEYWVFPIIEELSKQDSANSKEKIINIMENMVVEQGIVLMGIPKNEYYNKSKKKYEFQLHVDLKQEKLEQWFDEDMCFQMSNSIMRDLNIVKIKDGIDKEQKKFNDTYGSLIANHQKVLIKQNNIKNYLFERLEDFRELIQFEKNINQIEICDNEKMKKVKSKI